jgi:hypothetical protein
LPGGFSGSLGYSGAASYNVDATQQWGMTELTNSATADVKSAWFSLGKLKRDCAAVLLRINYLNNSGSETGVSTDIGIGLPGAQVVIAADINQGQPSGTPQTNLVTFQHVINFSLPAGTEIWIRSAVNVASSTPHLGGTFTPFCASFFALRRYCSIEAIGKTATGAGTVLVGGAGSKGGFVQLSSGLARDYKGFFLCADYAGTAGPVKALVDVAIGASGPIIAPNMTMCPQIGFSAVDTEVMEVQLMAGTPLYARACNLDGSTNSIGITAYGVR